jgi:transmembrane sensor
LTRLSEAVRRHGATDARLRAMADRAFDMGSGYSAKAPADPRSWRWRVALGACIMLTALGACLAAGLFGPHAVSYASPPGMHRDITLADGSLVHLDSASTIRVEMTEHQRQLDLLAGRAFFEVAHDAMRPFTVTINGDHVTALGTRFQVERQEQAVLVTLDEGSVVVSDSLNGAENHRQTLRPGEQLRIDRTAAPWVVRDVDTRFATSWSLGRLIFRATPLEEALAEMNRYAGKKVRLGDQSLAGLPLSGNFVSGDSALAVSAISAVLPIKAVDAGQEIVLFRRQDAASDLENNGG